MGTPVPKYFLHGTEKLCVHDAGPIRHVKRDFFAVRTLKLTRSKVNSSVLDYIVDEMQPLYTVEKLSFKNLITGLAPYENVPGRKALAVQIEVK